jgi:hypothetical protein
MSDENVEIIRRSFEDFGAFAAAGVPDLRSQA